MVMNLDSHLDVDFCREMGEQILIIPVGKNILLKSNGKQGDVYANARKADMIRRIGSACTRNLLHLNILHREELVDLLVMEHYPKRVSRADPPNLWPTVKHLIDGMTDAGLWPDDDSDHIRRTIFQLHPEPTGVKGVWRFEFHIIPLGEEANHGVDES